MFDANALSRRQLRSLHLAGTVAIPTPFPELGRLVFRPAEPDDLLGVEHEQSNRVTVVRTVRVSDVAAVMLTPPGKSGGEWFLGSEVAAVLESRSNGNQPGLLTGIVYVRESAPVLLQVEVGMTAAESAEYYPPVVGERSDAHYTLRATAGTTPVACDCDTRGTSRRRPASLQAEAAPAACDCDIN